MDSREWRWRYFLIFMDFAAARTAKKELYGSIEDKTLRLVGQTKSFAQQRNIYIVSQTANHQSHKLNIAVVTPTLQTSVRWRSLLTRRKWRRLMYRIVSSKTPYLASIDLSECESQRMECPKTSSPEPRTARRRTLPVLFIFSQLVLANHSWASWRRSLLFLLELSLRNPEQLIRLGFLILKARSKSTGKISSTSTLIQTPWVWVHARAALCVFLCASKAAARLVYAWKSAVTQMFRRRFEARFLIERERPSPGAIRLRAKPVVEKRIFLESLMLLRANMWKCVWVHDEIHEQKNRRGGWADEIWDNIWFRSRDPTKSSETGELSKHVEPPKVILSQRLKSRKAR